MSEKVINNINQFQLCELFEGDGTVLPKFVDSSTLIAVMKERDKLAEVNKVLVEALDDLKVQFDTFSKQQWSQITQVPVKENEFPRQDFIDFSKCFSALAKAKEMGSE